MRRLALLIAFVGSLGCKGDKTDSASKNAPETTEALEGPINVSLGDCAGTGTFFESGPRPVRFNRDLVEMSMSKRQPAQPATPADKSGATATGRDAADSGVKAFGESKGIDPPRQAGRYQMKHSGTDPKLAREQALEAARAAGIIGVLRDPAYGGAFASLTGDTDDGEEPMQGFTGAGPGGGGSGLGTIGTGKYGLIGHGSGKGAGYGGTRTRTRDTAPRIRIGNATVTGDLDKNIIRRYIRRKLRAVRACYEKTLETAPTASGLLMTTFQISPSGSVRGAKAQGDRLPRALGACVAGVVKTIQFPRPRSGGVVSVRYPFTFSPPAAKPAAKPAATADAKPSAAATPDATASKPPSVAKSSAPKHVPGSESVFVGKEKALEACFRKQTSRTAGVLVAQIASATAEPGAKIIGWGDEAVDSCVAAIVKGATPARPAGDRCPVAFGRVPVAELPGIDIGATITVTTRWGQNPATVANTTDVATMQSIEWKIPKLYERLLEATRERKHLEPAQVIAITGPFTIRPRPETSMNVVNRAVKSSAAAGTDFLLAAADEAGWRFLPRRGAPDARTLPVAPVPLGEGAAWSGLRPQHSRRVVRLRGAPQTRVSVLLTDAEIWVGMTTGDRRQIKKQGEEHDWKALEELLRETRSGPASAAPIELAAEDAVTYGEMVAAIDLAFAAGFDRWTLLDPRWLSVTFSEAP